MPELAEVRIMSDYINHHSNKRKFTKLYHVEKGNNPIDSELIEDFEVIAESFGKELQLKTKNDTKTLDFSVLWVCLVIGSLFLLKIGMILSLLE